MSENVAWSLAAILGAIALLNVYWASGGKIGSGAAVPVVDGKPLFKPSRAGKLIVAAAFALAGALPLASVYRVIPDLVAVVCLVALAVLFTVRAIGEFEYFGCFKRVQGTRFARWDTCLYVPLSIAISAMSLYLAQTYVPRGW